ncbi:MAG: S8 family serine peptidase, partial [Clostridiales bacterium]|nr:S8 family serine peptidase [Clostridiales bacterium]
MKHRQRNIKIAGLSLILAFCLTIGGPLSGALLSGDISGASQISSGGLSFQNVSDTAERRASQFLNGLDGESGRLPSDTVRVIVELDGTPLLKNPALEGAGGGAVAAYLSSVPAMRLSAQLLSEQRAVKDALTGELSISYRHSYTSIINGFSADIRYGDLALLRAQPHVTNVIVSESYAAPLAEAVENDVHVADTGIYDSSDAGYDGTGTVIAILDTGLDYTHSAFDPARITDPTKVAFGIEEVAARFPATEASKNAAALTAADVYVNAKVPYAYDYADSDVDVYPIESHGTHVAGIIAGKDPDGKPGGITGVAPQAQLAIFKVFSDVNSQASQDDIFFALSDCAAMGVDVINMSLGASAGFSDAMDERGTDELYQIIRDAGIALIVAAANDGSAAHGSANGDTNLTSNPDSGTIGSPASYSASFAVGSISGVKSEYVLANGVTAAYINKSYDVSNNLNEFVAPLLGGEASKTLEYVTVPGVGRSSNYAGISVAGKVALVKRGIITFEEKAEEAHLKGAIALIVYNNISGTISMSLGSFDKLPVCSVSLDSGEEMARYASGTLELSREYSAGPFMSSFSSWGVLPDLELKPEITAHGGDVYSSVPGGGYARLSGTSMSAPNMAGAIMLVRQYINEKFPALTSKEKTALAYRLVMSTATVARDEYGNPYSPRRQGAGLANIKNAVTTGAYIEVEGLDRTKLSLGDDKAKTGVYTLNFRVTNIQAGALSYRIDTQAFTESISSDLKTVAEKAYMFNERAVTLSAAGGSLAGDVLTVPGNGYADVTVTVRLSDGEKSYLDSSFVNGMFVEGFVRLYGYGASSAAAGLSIPWNAFYGDWTLAPMFDVSGYQIALEEKDPSIAEEDRTKAAAFATLPVGLFSTSSGSYSAYYMGAFAFTLKNEALIPAPAEEHAALSANPSAMFALYGLAAGMIRPAKTMDYSISNALTGEVMFSETQANIRRSVQRNGQRAAGMIYTDISAVPDISGTRYFNMPNNTSYTAEFKGTIDYPGAKNTLNDTFSFTYSVDSEAPQLLENKTVVREEERNGVKRYYVDFYVYDNHYLQAMYASTYSSIESGYFEDELRVTADNLQPIDGLKNATNKITLEVTDKWHDITANGMKMCVEFYDYARNSIQYLIKLPSAAEGISFSAPSGTIRPNESVDLAGRLTVTPSNVWAGLTWSSSNPAVAEVRDGLVQGKSAGTAVITAVTANGKAAQYEITVAGEPWTGTTPLQRLQISHTALSLMQGDSGTLSVDIIPWNVTETPALVWQSSNPGIISVTVDPTDQTKASYKVLGNSAAQIAITVGPVNSFISAACVVTIAEMFVVKNGVLTNFYGGGDENGVLVIPDDKGITSIASYVFYGDATIKKLVIPESVKTLEGAALAEMLALEEVVLPSGLTAIPTVCFVYDERLTTINMGHVISIGNAAFGACTGLTQIDLSTVKYIGDEAFAMTGLVSINIATVSHMGVGAFLDCPDLETITMSEATHIGNAAFVGCDKLTDLIIPAAAVGIRAA